MGFELTWASMYFKVNPTGFNTNGKPYQCGVPHYAK